MRKLEELTSINDLFEYLKDKKCICFGAGKQLEEACSDVPILMNYIECVLDNDESKHGTLRTINGHCFDIYGADYLLKCDPSKILLIITSSYKDEILDQLNADEKYSSIKYTDFHSIMDTAAWSAELPNINYKRNSEPVIPKCINYIWFSDNPIPKELQDNIDGWKRLCPDYEFKCWNEKNYDVTTNPYMHEAYKNKKWSFVSDYARLDIIYRYGGIYFDTDVEMVRRPDELLFNDAFIGFERISTVNTGSGFGAKKEHPIILEMRDFYNSISFENKENANEMILCPIYETAILEKHGLKRTGNFQVVDGMSVYPVMYFNAKSLYSDQLRITDRTISIHKCAWSWAGKKSKIQEFREDV